MIPVIRKFKGSLNVVILFFYFIEKRRAAWGKKKQAFSDNIKV